MKLSRVAVLFFFLVALASSAKAQLVSQGNEQIISYAGATAFILNNTPLNPNLLATTGTNTFIMNVNPPTNAARIYITNDTANACANVTVSMASTGNSSLNSFNSFVNAWQSVPLQTGAGAFANSVAITVPASGAIALTSQPIIGSKIAVFVVLSSACATTNIDLQVVFGTFSSGNPFVQGVVPPGGNASAVNPLIIGGPDASGNARVVNVIPFATLGAQINGLPIGGNDLANPGTFATVREPAGNLDGPLMVVLNAAAYTNCGPTSTGACLSKSDPAAGNAGGSGASNVSGGLYVADLGFQIGQAATITASGQVLNLWNVGNLSGTANGAIQTCHFTVVTTAPGGTTPTLNVYIQDSDDNIHWDDRVSFTQFTAAGTQTAGIAGSSANQAVAAIQSHTLAAGTINSGPLGAFGQAYFVVGGTSPSWPVAVYANCK